jgi:ABC-type sugar transport system ATPase subunit
VIRLEHFSAQAGSFSLRDVSLEIPAGAYGILMGRTGSGKTTLLEAVCGLKSVTAGRVVLCGRDVTRLKPGERGVGFVPQDGALFPTMTVGQQLGFALAIRRWKPAAIRERVRELADVLGIEHLLDRTPQGLSGGERQRVALGRALSFRPGVLCLDEPLSALDEATREDICRLLESVTRQSGVTTLHITHSHREAERLGDVLFVLSNGRLERVTGEDEAMLPDVAETPA